MCSKGYVYSTCVCLSVIYHTSGKISHTVNVGFFGFEINDVDFPKKKLMLLSNLWQYILVSCGKCQPFCSDSLLAMHISKLRVCIMSSSANALCVCHSAYIITLKHQHF